LDFWWIGGLCFSLVSSPASLWPCASLVPSSPAPPSCLGCFFYSGPVLCDRPHVGALSLRQPPTTLPRLLRCTRSSEQCGAGGDKVFSCTSRARRRRQLLAMLFFCQAL
jgi:hypothetical protein